MEGPLWEAHKKCLDNQYNVKCDFYHQHDKGHERFPISDRHIWREDNIERVAKLRQAFLNYFLDSEEDYDYACMVDSDLLLSKGTLIRLVAEIERLRAQVAYGVFWTDWGAGPQPQCWQEHPYGFRDQLFFTRLHAGDTMECVGGGACTLFTRAAAEQARYHPRLDGLPLNGAMWRGEDRTFALCCEVSRLKQIAVGGVKVVHLYSAFQRTEEAIQHGLELVGQA